MQKSVMERVSGGGATLLKQVFSVRNQNCHKVVTVLGKKFRFSNWPLSTSRYDLCIKTHSWITFKDKMLFDWLNFVVRFLTFSQYDWNSDRFKSDYENLIRGLDSSSIASADATIAIYKRYDELTKMEFVGIKEIREFQKLCSATLQESQFINDEFHLRIVEEGAEKYSYKNYYLPVEHFESSVFYHRHSIDELKTLDKIKDKNIIDVGGFIGDSALVFSPYTNKKIYSFEASSENFELMKKTIELNKLENVVPVYCALGDTSGKTFSLSSSGSCTHVSTASDSEANDAQGVESVTLDDYVRENNLDVGLIKVDIEGFEQEFLRGAKNTIMTQKPALLISIYHKPEDYLYIKPIIESWNLGYKFRIICPPENRLFETLLVAEVL